LNKVILFRKAVLFAVPGTFAYNLLEIIYPAKHWQSANSRQELAAISLIIIDLTIKRW